MQGYRIRCVVNVVYVAACSVNNTTTQYKVSRKRSRKQRTQRGMQYSTGYSTVINSATEI